MQVKRIAIGSSTFDIMLDTTKRIVVNNLEFHKFVKTILPIVDSCIRKYCKAYIACWDKDDYRQELMPVIFTSIVKYDSTKNTKFTTFLVSNIKNKVINIYEKSGKRYYVKRYKGNLKQNPAAKDDYKLVLTQSLLNPMYISELVIPVMDPTTED